MTHVFYSELFSEFPRENDRNEAYVAEYFRRRGWSVERIDDDEHIRPSGFQKPDWLISGERARFLCEVKTIHSARRGDHHEKDFDQYFRDVLVNHFRLKKFRNIPYDIMVDNPTMTAPLHEESLKIAEWLEQSIFQLYQGQIPKDWEAVPTPYGYFYSAAYRLVSYPERSRSIYVRVSSHETGHNLRITIPSYGGINSRSLQSCIRQAIKQLADEAKFQRDAAIPRIVAISMRDGIQFDWSDIIGHVKNQLYRYTELSAVALFTWIPETSDFWQLDSRWFLGFLVLHNPYVTNTRLLTPDVFKDGFSKQHHDLDQLIRRLSVAGL